MHVPAICLLKSMTYTRCSQAIAWHFAGVYGSIFRPRWRAQRSSPALPAFMAAHPELELEVSSTDRQVDLVQEGFDCVLRLGPVGDETLIASAPLGLLRMVNAAQSRLSSALWSASIMLEDLQRPGTSDNSFFFDDAGRKDPMDGNIRTATATRRFSCEGALHVNSAQTYESRCPRRPWPDSGHATLGDWPILRECGALVEIMHPIFVAGPSPCPLVVAHIGVTCRAESAAHS